MATALSPSDIYGEHDGMFAMFAIGVPRLRLLLQGSLESFLLLRSLRTLEMRVTRQAANGAALAQWLHKVSQTPAGQSWDGVRGGAIKHVWHATLQGEKDQEWIKKQMPGGGPACFSIMVRVHACGQGTDVDVVNSSKTRTRLDFCRMR